MIQRGSDTSFTNLWSLLLYMQLLNKVQNHGKKMYDHKAWVRNCSLSDSCICVL